VAKLLVTSLGILPQTAGCPQGVGPKLAAY